MQDHLKRHAPTAGIAATTALAVSLAVSPDAAPTVRREPPAANVQRSPSLARVPDLADCGDASITGDDYAGHVEPGAPLCTVVFARPWLNVPTCSLDDAALVSLTETELTVSAPGPFTYRCGGPK